MGDNISFTNIGGLSQWETDYASLLVEFGGGLVTHLNQGTWMGHKRFCAELRGGGWTFQLE